LFKKILKCPNSAVKKKKQKKRDSCHCHWLQCMYKKDFIIIEILFF